MKFSFVTSALTLTGSVSLCLLQTTAQAQTITTLFNTGVVSPGVLAAGGTTDLHYALVSAPAGAVATAFVSTTLPGPYQANGPNSQWIGPAPDLSQGFPTGAPYDYRTVFDLTGRDPSTAAISGLFASDDDSEIFLNGVDTGVGLGNFTSSLTLFTLPTGVNFVSGINTLDFVVNNLTNALKFTIIGEANSLHAYEPQNHQP